MLTLSHVTKRFPGSAGPALDDVSLTVRPGEMVALLGSSGAGKSTLIRTINGLVRPDSGFVSVDGQQVSQLTGAALQALRRRVAMIFQEYHLIDRLPVLTNVVLGGLGRYGFARAVFRQWPAADVAEATRLLDRVGLHGLERSLARDLSGGQRQRVAAARAMMQNPGALLGDEPVSSLDPVTARGVLQLLADLTQERQLATVITLHDVGLARQFCARSVGIRAGRIRYDGPTAALTEERLNDLYGGETGPHGRSPLMVQAPDSQ